LKYDEVTLLKYAKLLFLWHKIQMDSHMDAAVSLRRSILFVPGGHQQRIEKSAAIPADVLVFDLEDAVPSSEKDNAREIVFAALRTIDFGQRQCIVRINDVSTNWFQDDMAALSEIDNCAIMLPKYQAISDIAKLEAVQQGNKKQVFGIIETALGVLKVAELAQKLQTTDALCFGHVDFAADMGLANNDSSHGSVYHARCQVALAAHAYGVSAMDNISLEVRDDEVIQRETVEGLNLGYQGKLCIHPRQVAIANEVYTPTEQQVSKAKSILEQWEEVKAGGEGVFTFENKMVDLPVIHVQQTILARYNAIISRANNND